MDGIAFVIGRVLPYVTIVIFLAGIISRFYLWARTPMPGSITLFPAPKTGAGTVGAVLQEAFLFRGLFRSSKSFWTASWVFHAMLLLIFVGHVRVFTDFPRFWAALGMTTTSQVDRFSALTGGTAGVIVLGMAGWLLWRRFTKTAVREISNAADYAVLLLIIGILITGDAMRFVSHFDLADTREYFARLATFSAAEVPMNGWFLLHFLSAQVLLIVIPFSKILHFGGLFFSHAIIHKA